MLNPTHIAVASVNDGIAAFGDFNDHTTNVDYKTLLAGYEAFRNLFSEPARVLYRKRNSANYRRHLADFEEAFKLVETYVDTSLRNVRSNGSDEAKRGLPQLELAVALMKQLGQGELRKMRLYA